MTIRISVLPLLLAFAAIAPTGHAAPAKLDPRLGSFLEFVIQDPEVLESEQREYAENGVTFEAFVYAVYTRKVEFDETPDNAQALAQLGRFLEEQRPVLDPRLGEQMAEFLATEANRTFMRGMFLQTVRGLSGQGSAKEAGAGKGAGRTIRFGGLENEATGTALLARDGAFLEIRGIAASGADGVRIRLPKGATQVRVRAQFPGEERLSEGDYVEIVSGLSGAAESLGVLRITRSSDAHVYDVSGAVAGAASRVLVLLRRGSEVFREALSPGDGRFARVNTLIRFESSLNDDVGRLPGRDAVLRWEWSSPSPVTIVGRAAGADTTLAADELRLLGAGAASGTAPTLSELRIRGRNLGTIRIRAEEVARSARSSRAAAER